MLSQIGNSFVFRSGVRVILATEMQCRKECESEAHCTHFNWVKGVCFLRNGTVAFGDALFVDEDSRTCGLINDIR
jgi:hypothetical protein